MESTPLTGVATRKEDAARAQRQGRAEKCGLDDGAGASAAHPAHHQGVGDERLEQAGGDEPEQQPGGGVEGDGPEVRGEVGEPGHGRVFYGTAG